MGKQTYALTSRGLYDNGQATIFFLEACTIMTKHTTLHYF
ncbi:hypothetical protein NC652_004356 [Populus alba x Populus x berolinensis]|nr:hypothetical protein NC652_004356 [Populus alba x Populus x berolinensis]